MADKPKVGAKLPKRDYATLDAILVVGVLALLGYALWALVTREIPQAQLAIFSSLVSGSICAILAAYAAFRWAQTTAADDPKPHAPGEASVSVKVTAPADATDKVDG
jgi:hypothetical protein